ncbi:MAG: hypothetical protein ACTHMC_19590 [Pseudobacter sp.]|uniref:hypothetical protein n=1 Tax=Pseudobacter sp. TaxID=2045420 RepID=UPI003F81F5D0
MYDCEFNISGFSECFDKFSKRKIATEGMAVNGEMIKNILNKKYRWHFNWMEEYKKPDRRLFYLRTCTEDRRLQGLISATPKIADKYIFLHLIESAPHNLGASKQYEGVPQSLVAYMCKASFELGLEGYVVFEAKTALIGHYIKKFGAELIYPRLNRMCISTKNAENLVNLYIKKL